MDGKIDSLAVNGQDLTLTLDSELRQYGEYLIRGKRGGIVTLEPSSGEILALITALATTLMIWLEERAKTPRCCFFTIVFTNLCLIVV